MDSRVFFSTALLAVALFHSVAMLADAQSSPSPVLTREAGRAKLSALEQKAEAGGAHDQYLLGLAYMTGSRVSQDYKLAAELVQGSGSTGRS